VAQCLHVACGARLAWLAAWRVAIDGKALRRGYEKGRAFMPPLMVSAWDAETRLAIAATRAPASDEVGANTALLKSLDLKGLHGHGRRPCIAVPHSEALIAKKAHYALGLKANRGRLFCAAEKSFAAAARFACFEPVSVPTAGTECAAPASCHLPGSRTCPCSPASRPSAARGPAHHGRRQNGCVGPLHRAPPRC